MARKKRSGKLRPRIPSRVKKRTRKKKTQRGHHHPELWGLGMVAAGCFLATLFWFGWDGGVVGGAVQDGFEGAVGAAAFVAPAVLVVLGLLMVARSALVDVSPFRTGLIVVVLGLLLSLGDAHGGAVGDALDGLVELLLGSTGATIVGVTTLAVGALLLSGASVGAFLRRSHHAVRTAARNRARPPVAAPPPPAPESHTPPVDAVHDFPDVVGEPAPLLAPYDEAEAESPAPTLFDDTLESHSDYRLPDRTLLRESSPAKRPATSASHRHSCKRSRTSASRRRSSGRSPARA
jgi:hypothetical protein